MKARRVLVAAILAVYAVLHTSTAIMYGVGPMRFCAAFWGIACAVGAVALMRNAFWARRYVMGAAIAGLLNCVAYFGYFRDWGGFYFGALQFGAFAAGFLLLMGKRMRAHYDERASHWHFDHPTMHVLSAALSLNVAGVAMLVYYACLDDAWTTPSLRASSLCLAAILSIGTVLSARGRILGLFIMTGAGVASIALGWSAMQHVLEPSYIIHDCGEWQRWTAWGKWETVKSVVGFAPAALGTLFCFGVFVSPMIRFLKNRASS